MEDESRKTLTLALAVYFVSCYIFLLASPQPYFVVKSFADTVGVPFRAAIFFIEINALRTRLTFGTRGGFFVVWNMG